MVKECNVNKFAIYLFEDLKIFSKFSKTVRVFLFPCLREKMYNAGNIFFFEREITRY